MSNFHLFPFFKIHQKCTFFVDPVPVLLLVAEDIKNRAVLSAKKFWSAIGWLDLGGCNGRWFWWLATGWTFCGCLLCCWWLLLVPLLPFVPTNRDSTVADEAVEVLEEGHDWEELMGIEIVCIANLILVVF